MHVLFGHSWSFYPPFFRVLIFLSFRAPTPKEWTRKSTLSFNHSIFQLHDSLAIGGELFVMRYLDNGHALLVQLTLLRNSLTRFFWRRSAKLKQAWFCSRS